jgi:sulfate permease, SulP family
LKHIGDTSIPTLLVSLGVIAVIVGGRMITRKVPGALVAVVGAITVSYTVGLSGHGVSVLGTVPGGLPHMGPPSVGWGDILPLLATAASIFLVILAQSAATSRAYAAKYNEEFDENTDLVGLGFSNLIAGFSGTFVVNGSPTKTQMVDGAGGRSQLAQLTTSAAVLVVLLFLTGPLQYLPNAVLAAVVFLIGVELVDIRGMRRILDLRVDEFIVAVITATTVVLVGVEQGILLAIALSIVAHLRHSYRPRNVVLVPADTNRFHLVPAQPGGRTLDGLVIYRFGANLYYANVGKFFDEVMAFTKDGKPLKWFCLDASAVNDIDYSAAQTLRQIHDELKSRGVQLYLSDLTDDLRNQVERYGITHHIGPDAIFETAADVLDACRSDMGLAQSAASSATAHDD